MNATAIKERPLLYSGPMVRAILAGDKSQTRRVMQPQPIQTRASQIEWRPKGSRYVDAVGGWAPAYTWNVTRNPLDTGAATIVDRCPHGQPGERLWVRETWVGPDQAGDDWPYEYRADCFDPLAYKWRPSIFMPRAASRITLEITDVRVERVQSISPADALAEGIAEWAAARGYADSGRAHPVEAFAELWDEINAKRGFDWESNPWVWVVGFKRIESEVGS